jgi:DNA-binding winged helix-turn-helix (wHTH) protein
MTGHPKRLLLRFGLFEFDVIAGELYHEGRRVPLQEHPRQVLATLLERPGEIATREELRDRLWKTDTLVDFEHGLSTAIKKMRQALGDSAAAPQYIETLARRGYRFIAPVIVAEDSHQRGLDPQSDHPGVTRRIDSNGAQVADHRVARRKR